MSHEGHLPARPAHPADLGGIKPASPRDVVWDRPVFRAPALPSPRAVFDPLPFRAHAFGSHRLVAGR